jgi:hypothetical protein
MRSTVNEQDFKNALRETMVSEPAPPPMNEVPVLEAAHRDRRRRRAMWAGLGSAAAVAAIAVGVVVVAPPASGGAGGGVNVGGQQPPEIQSTQDAPQPSAGGAKESTMFPPGMTDRTPTAGPQFDRGVALGTALDEVVPAGYEAADNLKGGGEPLDAVAKHHQANFEDTVDNVDLYSFMATTPVTKDDGVGMLIAEVRMPGTVAAGEGCALAPLWGAKGACSELVVDGKRVAMVTDIGEDDRIDQWAGYRHDDGTVVYIGQSADYWGSGLPALAGLPLTPQQLTAAAVDPRFNLD